MVSFILCLLPALLATTSAQTTPGQTLTCNTCFGQTEACNFAPGTCQANKATGGCLSVAEDITLDGTQNTNFYKQCLSSYKSDIEVPISFTVGNGKYVRINTTRCNTDNCNSAVLGVPTGSTTENGLQCPTCFALNFALCNSSVTPCTGDETYCIDFTGFLYQGSSHSPFQAKGCATASAQAIKPGANLATALYTFDFYWGSSVLAEKIPTNPPPITATSRETPTATPNTTTPSRTTSPETTTTKKTTTIPKTTPTPTTTTTHKPTTPSKTPTTTKTPATTKIIHATTSGASPALGKFSFALYLPGLTGLLLVKLLS
ncbi:phospholipase A2 inhibitor and Ly6/PLAUR domain-containing protein-like isoform X2 [Malaclemys terrapin pileata]|uniref:phospholipase A2 inhibitor and Ly6/PLAUR domain-containing protein-like isoform X2 n=1 Tax=Malaclemys terrapin pileata TaxID=2991368 RepID=UPI0023A79995|nr:phospholipase A2 inhibitor and Ly6/PLAUR domain-containing protein-like isoform X2 [Malaclemys terrapin pileata]